MKNSEKYLLHYLTANYSNTAKWGDFMYYSGISDCGPTLSLSIVYTSRQL